MIATHVDLQDFERAWERCHHDLYEVGTAATEQLKWEDENDENGSIAEVFITNGFCQLNSTLSIEVCRCWTLQPLPPGCFREATTTQRHAVLRQANGGALNQTKSKNAFCQLVRTNFSTANFSGEQVTRESLVGSTLKILCDLAVLCMSLNS